MNSRRDRASRNETRPSRPQPQPSRRQNGAGTGPLPPSPPRSSSPPRPPTPDAVKQKRKECEEALKDARKTKKPKLIKVNQPKKKKRITLMKEGCKYYKRCIDAYLPLYTIVLEGVKWEQKENWSVLAAGLPDTGVLPPGCEDRDQDPEGDRDAEVDDDEAQVDGHQDERGQDGDPEQDPQDPQDPQDGQDGQDGQEPEPSWPADKPDEDDESTAFHKHCIEAWQKLKKKCPAYVEYIDWCAEKGEVKFLTDLMASLTKTSNQVLYDDNNTLKTDMRDLLNPNVYTGLNTLQTFSSKGSKADRGIGNDGTLEVMVNWEDIRDYLKGDDATKQEILDQYRVEPVKPLNASGFPALLYDVLLVEDPESEEFETGYLLSPFLIRCAADVLTSGNAASQNKHVDVARSMDMRVVTAEFMAYLATRVRFALSASSNTNKDDEDFSFSDFYYNVLAVYRRLKPEQQQEIVQFWNKGVFGNAKGRVEKSLCRTKPQAGSNLERFFALRDAEDASAAAKAAEAAAAEAAAASSGAAPTPAA
ncbi:hypothetical protein PM082_021170 [Marasmius tenuissimus]|nr:hypothetical protein PM082_021170 [Marasmius tenuissimus]